MGFPKVWQSGQEGFAALWVERDLAHLMARMLGLTAYQVELIEGIVQRRASASTLSNLVFWRADWKQVQSWLAIGDSYAVVLDRLIWS